MKLNKRESLKHKVLVFDVDHIGKDERSPNARNWIGVVLMNKKQCGDLYQPILAQEVFESRFKYNPVNLLLLLISRSIKIKMESRGQETSVQVAAGLALRDEFQERQARAKKLAKSYKQFDGMNTKEIRLLMMNVSQKAKLWAKRRGFIA